MKRIYKMLQFIASVAYEDEWLDEDYTIFILEGMDGSLEIKWDYGKYQLLKAGDLLSKKFIAELRTFETLPEKYAKKELIEWDQQYNKQ